MTVCILMLTAIRPVPHTTSYTSHHVLTIQSTWHLSQYSSAPGFINESTRALLSSVAPFFSNPPSYAQHPT